MSNKIKKSFFKKLFRQIVMDRRIIAPDGTTLLALPLAVPTPRIGETLVIDGRSVEVVSIRHEYSGGVFMSQTMHTK